MNVSESLLPSYIWKEILNSYTHPIVILNENGKIIYANRSAEKKLGYYKKSVKNLQYNSPDWNIATTYGTPFPDNELPFVRVKNTLQPVYNIKHSIDRPDGTKIFLNIDAFPILDEIGNLNYVICQIEDISEQFALEKDRNIHYRNYQLLFKNMSHAFALHRMVYNSYGQPVDFIFIDINQKFTDITGIPRSKILGKHVTEIKPQIRESPENWIEKYAKVAKGGDPLSFEQYDRYLDHNLLINVYSPEPDYFVTLFVEIDDRVKWEKELQKKELKYRTLFHNSAVGVGISSKDGKIIEINKRMCQIFGYSEEEMFKINTKELYVNPEQREQILNELEKKGKVSNFELLGKRRNGNLFEAILSMTPIELEGESYFLTSVQDISEIRAMEREKEKIEQKVRNTQRLESLGLLAGGIAHDFNNLLVGIMGNAELVQMNIPESSKNQENLKDIFESAKKASQLSQQLLMYAGKRTITEKKIDLNQEIRDIHLLLTRVVSQKAKFILDLDKNLPQMRGDPTQIQQVIMNLITNASDALDDQPGTIHLRTYNRYCDPLYLKNSFIDTDLAPGEYILLEVEDSGIGINSKILPKIFDPFFTTKSHGRGLGLSTVLGIIKKHNGNIIINTEVGHGSTFSVLFPIHDTSNLSAETRESSSNSIIFSNLTVLLVDDEQKVLKVGKQYLEYLGAKVITCNEGHAALEILMDSSSIIDMVILDLIMPEMDGFHLFQKIRQVKKKIPIFISSGYSQFDIHEKFADYQIAGFLQKPYSLKDLKQTLNSWKMKTEK